MKKRITAIASLIVPLVGRICYAKKTEITPTSRVYKVVVIAVVSAILGCASTFASETVYETNNYTKATHEEMVEDMRVKVLGGSIAVNRYYRVIKQRVADADGNILYVGVSGATGAFSGNSLRGRSGSSFRSAGGGGGGSASGSASSVDVSQPSASYGVWQFHRKWHDLVFLDRDLSTFPAVTSFGSSSGGGSGDTSISSFAIEPKAPIESGGAKYIDRNDFVYVKRAGTDYFQYQHNGADLRITETDTGYRWSNRNGDWIDYDEKGKAVRSGDKNNVTITLARNSDGYISQYKDHFDRVVLTYSYVGNKPVRVEDYTGRVVTYDWDGNYLKKVTTTRGHDWAYDYEAINNNFVLTKKTDPENQVFSYDYEVSGGGYAPIANSNGNITTIGDANRVGNFSSISGGGGGGSSARSIGTVPVESMLMLREKVYPDGKRQRYQYFYDQDSKTYTLVETDSDGYERERWFDLDGQTQRQFKGGLLANKRIRNSRTAVSTDAYGNQTVTQYTRWEAVASVTHPDGSSKRYEYLANYNFPTLETDEIGVRTKHEYDNNGNRTKTIKGLGSNDERIVEFDYDQYGQVKVERYIGRDTTPTIEILYDYDDYGNLIKKTDARGNVMEYKNFNAIGQYQEMIDGRGNSWLYQYDAHGNKTRETTPLGFITQYEYDRLHRLVKTIDAELRQTTYEYDSRDNVVKETNNLDDSRLMTYRFDRKILSNKDESNQLTTYRYDRSARLIETADGVGNITTIAYERGDELAGERIQKVTTPNNVLFLKHDERNREVQRRAVSTAAKDDGLENKTSVEYSARNERLKVIDGNNNTTTYVLNPHRQVISQTNAELETVRYKYDVRGNLLSVTDAELSVTSYEYDANNNKVAEIRPMGEKQTYSYDANDNLSTHTDYNGNVAAYAHDIDDRVALLTNTKTGENTPERTVSYSFDKTNRDLGFNDGVTSTVYQLDNLGRKEQQTTTFISAGFSKVLTTDYYANNQIKTRVDAEGNPTLYTYDGAGKLKSIQITNAGTVLIDEYEGDLPTRIIYPGGTERTLDYDGLARLKHILVKDNAGTALMDYQYGFDPVGNVLSRTTGQGNFHYEYDKVYRLLRADQPNSFGNQSYTYDNNGNRKTHNNAGVDISYAHNGNHELNEIVEDTVTSLLSYDNNGAVALEQNDSSAIRYTYNSFARIEQIHESSSGNPTLVAEYQYDAMSRRVVKAVGGETIYFLYTDAGLRGEYDSDGKMIRGYVYKPQGLFTTDPVAIKTLGAGSNPVSYIYSYYQNDHLGTPQQLIQGGGQVVWKGQYDVFGEVVETKTIVGNPLRFPGQYHDQEVGLYYNWNRYYSPPLGRYIKNDPIGLQGGINSYSYAGNRTLFYIDPRGLDLETSPLPKQEPLVPIPDPDSKSPSSGPDVQIVCPPTPAGYSLVDMELTVLEKSTCIFNKYYKRYECDDYSNPKTQVLGWSCKVKCIYAKSGCASKGEERMELPGSCDIQAGPRFERPSPYSA